MRLPTSNNDPVRDALVNSDKKPKPKDDMPHDDPYDPMLPHVEKGLRVNDDENK